MSKWINADALIEAIGEEPYVWTDSAEEIAERNQWLTDMHTIENAPSIDIVRCNECYMCDEEMWCSFYDSIMESDDFCSYGERRSDE